MDELKDDLKSLLRQGYRYALALVHDPAQAEDLLQDAWIAVLNANGPHEKGYLFSAIRSRFLNHARRESLVTFVPIETQAEIEEHDAGGELDAHFALEDLEPALQQLRPLEREALFLSAAAGYTAQEIAEHNQTTRGTVLSLLHRARKKLHTILNPAESAEVANGKD